MTEQSWDPRTCNERAGFLFQHECGSLPESHCGGCGKPVCTQHTHFVDNAPFCTTCAKQDQKQRRQETRSQRRSSHYEDYDDPYFYGDRHYDGYGRYRPGYWGYAYYSASSHSHGAGHDSYDFTGGDAESVMHEGDGDFESDMSES